ncbi:alcohol dehydrogenase [Steroidobacter agaridevorans]|uniref:Alcohol dehydrogenase n=1 Tax=Steroidobacter agaridevorans TaxID=2695856 RepID=A0A829Y5P3_9GAMM|nr:PQQ-dependent dehydrogenase, methanol/ethanol family [Steroidobacter agaridevorans]GFE78520.1 alcohol dehydrogenase [Steroidobacter agaridevorans]
MGRSRWLVRMLLVVGALNLGACGKREEPAKAPATEGAHEAAPEASYGRVDRARVVAADSEPQNWFTTGRTFSEERFSPLEQINIGNVQQLGFAWQYDLQTERGLEATPVVVDGVLFASSNWSKVYALDARTGRELWAFDPQVPGEWARNACCDVVNRGVAVWQGKVYVGTLDGRLIALDAATGKPLWSQDTLVDRSRSYTITGAPRIAGGKVIIGNGGGEFGVRGYITAYDAESGAQAWRFFTVPGDPKHPFEHPELEAAAKTWDPNSRWEAGGGGTAWDSMAYDPQLNLLYVGTGNASPFPQSIRSPKGGDNLYLSSILAIDPQTGRLAWHYQTTPGESWDYTAVQHIVLTDLQIGGTMRKVLLQAPKNGFFYVLDRATGELLSAQKYVDVNWASHVDLNTGRPMPTGKGDYSKEPKRVAPGPFGGHNWQPMAFSPKTGLVYIPTLDRTAYYAVDPEYKYIPRRSFNTGRDFTAAYVAQVRDGAEMTRKGALKAWDPIAQREVWRVDYPWFYNGGLLATAGNLVFQGTTDGYLKAYTADTGKLAAEVFVGTSIMAAPATYAVDGEQFIAVLAGYGGAQLDEFLEGSAARKYGNTGRIVAFKLGGGKVPVPPEKDWDANIPPLPARMHADAATLDRGALLFGQHCGVCHSLSDEPGGYPNLLRLTPGKHAIFDEIVLRGAMAGRGMAGFSNEISEADAHAIHAYLIDKAYEASAKR